MWSFFVSSLWHTGPPKCAGELDLIFVLDNSGSAASFLDQINQFTLDIINQFELGWGATRAYLRSAPLPGAVHSLRVVCDACDQASQS